MEKFPMVSVIMSVYKEPIEWLSQSIDSILNQTFTDFEFIIICDNPQFSEGISLLRNLAEKENRIVLLFNEENIGLTKSLNKGLAIAKGNYIARMDADDISCTIRLEREVEYLENNDTIDICCSNFSYIDENGNVIKNKVVPIKRRSQDYLLWHNVYGHSTVMFRRSVLKARNPLYNESYRCAQDYELWTYLSSCGLLIGFVDNVLLLYRQSTHQISAKKSEEQLHNLETARRCYIYSLLKNNKIIVNDTDVDAKILLERINKAYPDFSDAEKRKMDRIIYILYYTLSCKSPKYVARYFADLRMRKMEHWIRDDVRLLFAPILGEKHKSMIL